MPSQATKPYSSLASEHAFFKHQYRLVRCCSQVFPRKLYEILNEDDTAIMWTASGLAFHITNMKEFCGSVLTNYFRHHKYSSFLRQLNLYGFHKVSKGPDVGSYAHPRFMRGREDLLPEVQKLPKGHALKGLPAPSGQHSTLEPPAPGGTVPHEESAVVHASIALPSSTEGRRGAPQVSNAVFTACNRSS